MTEEEELEELKKALDKKQIEFNIGTDENPEWVHWENPSFDCAVEDYRIKKETE